MRRYPWFLSAYLILSVLVLSAEAAERVQPANVVAKCTELEGAVVYRTSPDSQWKALKKDEGLAAGSLVVALPKAQLVSANGAVKLDMLADIGKRGPYPVLESAVILQDPDSRDLSFILDRGIVALTNMKDGPATVRFQIEDKAVDIKLLEPGTQMVMELYARHPAGGEMFSHEEGQTDKVVEIPSINLVCLVIKGKLQINVGDVILGMKAPPGPARLHWDNLTGLGGVERLEKLPDSVRPLTPEEATRAKELVSCVECITSRPLKEVLPELLASDKKLDRMAGVIAAGATDQIGLVIKSLSDPKHADVRDAAVIALRHWMGRRQGQAQKLYEAFKADQDYTPITARVAIQLLDGVSEEDAKRLSTIEVLMVLLESKNVGIRQLAWWNLQRVLPGATELGFDPAASENARQTAVQGLRRLQTAYASKRAATGDGQ